MSRRLRLLFVEDSEDDALLIVSHLVRNGYEIDNVRVYTAAALESAMATTWDAVIVDFRLPSLSGIGAIGIIRRHDADVPIILVSGTIGEELAAEAIRSGAGDFVPKANLTRLVPALERELREAANRRLQRQREREFRDMETQFRATFERAAVGIALGTVDGRILRINAAFAAMLGYDADELIGRNFAEFSHPDDQSATALRVGQATASAESVVVEKRYRSRNGAWFWALATFSPVTQGDDRFIIGVVTDISARKAAEQAVRDSETRYRLLMEHASDGIVISDHDLKIIELNTVMCNLFGGPREQIIGKHLTEFTLEEEPIRTRELFETGSVVTCRRVRRLDGTAFDAEISATVLPDGRLEGIVRDVTERNRIQEKLRINEERFRLVALATNDAVMDIDRVAGTVWTNDHFGELFGVPPAEEDERLRWCRAHVHPDDRDRVFDSVRMKLATTTAVAPVEYRWIRDDGRVIPVLERYAVTLRDDGEIARLIVTMMDLTEQKRTEEALRASEAKFRRVFDSNIVGLHFWRSDGTIAEANDAFLKIVGVTRAECEAGLCNWREMTAPEFRALSLDKLREVRAAGVCAPFEKEYLHRDGERVRVMVAAATLGSMDEGVTVTVDITERQKASEALRTSEARFRATLENSSDVISVLDRTGRIMYQSPSSLRLLGYAPEELVGASAFDRIHPDDRVRVQEVFAEGIASGRNTETAEFRFQARNGSWLVLEAIGHNLINEPGVHGIVVNSRDITQRRAYEQRLAQAERVSSIGRLAATMAHEFNNILMGIQPFAEIIRRKCNGEASIASACNHIETSVQRGRRVTQEVLRFTRPVEPTIARVDVNEWFADVGGEMAEVLGDKYRLAVIHAPGSPAIAGDRAVLTQAVMNLIVNARDAMPTGGTITLAAFCRSDDMICVSVSDTGCGIAEADRERIFEPLYTTKRGGTGLGLPLTHQIVTSHGGTISVQSEPGKGTTFEICIPRRHDDVAEKPVETATKPKSAPARVLIVEDDCAVAEGIATILEAEGYGTKIVGCGNDAAPAIVSFKPDVVLLDVGLPDTDGVTLHSILAARHAGVEFVLATGHADLARLNQKGGSTFRFLQKPFESSELIATIESALQHAAAV